MYFPSTTNSFRANEESPKSAHNDLNRGLKEEKEDFPKVDAVVTRSLKRDLATGLRKSDFLLIPLIFSVIAVGGLFALYHFILHSSPAPWAIAAAAVGGYAAGFFAQLSCKKGLQKFSFEISALPRLFKKNYDLVFTTETGRPLYLGALPNRLLSEGENLAQRENVKAILSINESWERKPYGFSLPYKEKDWNELGVAYEQIDVEDHTLLSVSDMHKAADFIHKNIQQGGVYVHCRAGRGRSGMGIAAYLIKYQNMSVVEAQLTIEQGRPISTVRNKTSGLSDFLRDCRGPQNEKAGKPTQTQPQE